MNTKLKWRLKEQPSTESLRELVKDGILTKDEAREILFSSETEEDRDKKSLESEVRFLRDLVEKLSRDRTQIVEVIREIRTPYYQQPWYSPYGAWCSSGTIGLSTTVGASDSLTFTTSGTNTSNNAFSSISTF